jgi:hypothetical protein
LSSFCRPLFARARLGDPPSLREAGFVLGVPLICAYWRAAFQRTERGSFEFAVSSGYAAETFRLAGFFFRSGLCG